MAASSSSQVVPPQPPQVFINFRGELRNTFVSHLVVALKQAEINCYIDSDEIRSEDKRILFKRIQESQIALCIFSAKYVESGWCLDELVKIMDEVKKDKLKMIPIFFDVKPEDVGGLKNIVAEKLYQGGRHSRPNMALWEKALMSAPDKMGLTLEKSGNNEAKLIVEIVSAVKQVVAQPVSRQIVLSQDISPVSSGGSHSSETPSFDVLMDQLKEMMNIDSSETQIFGIVGMPGIGKTALAEKYFNEGKHKFVIKKIIRGIHGKSGGEEGEKWLQNKLLKGQPFNEAIKLKKKIFLVLDDVSNKNQVDFLLKNREWIKEGSKIIITTRDKLSIAALVHHIYVVPGLNDTEASKLFKLHAFYDEVFSTVGNFPKLTKKFVDYAGGNPRALEELGKELCGKDEARWEEKLVKLPHECNPIILNELRIIYDTLTENQKDAFLDITCFSNFAAKYELGKEVGRGHFGHTYSGRGKKGEIKDQPIAVKIISKAKITTAIGIEDVRREVKLLKSLCGHKHLIRYYDACEDANNVYIVMELCEGGELLDRILARGGKYPEDDAKAIVVQILNVVSFCHLQGVVHRDLKPENVLFTSSREDSDLKLIDFGLSNFIRPDERLNDIVGSAYYVAPEVLHRSYSLEADIWSIGVITYILLCGSRPFWARTGSGIFRTVLRAEPNYDDIPWPSCSSEGKEFVKRLLKKDYRKRMSAVQALTHPWLRDDSRAIPLDILIYKLVKAYLHATPLRRAALKSLAKALTENELVYLRAQFMLLVPNKDGSVSLENFKMALMQNATDAMRESRVPEILNTMEALAYRKMYFEEFCAAAISIHQLEAVEAWEEIATAGFQHFETEGNRVITIEDLVRELNVGASAYGHLREWVRSSDGKLSYLGFTKFLHGVTLRAAHARPR